MKQKILKHYLVVSPEISEVVPVLDFGMGPLEYYRCCAYIEAYNKREAKIKALRSDEMYNWIEWARGDRKNPFSGLKVEEILESDFNYEEEDILSD